MFNGIKYIWVLYFDKDIKPIEALTQTINSAPTPLKKPYKLYNVNVGSFEHERTPLLIVE